MLITKKHDKAAANHVFARSAFGLDSFQAKIMTQLLAGVGRNDAHVTQVPVTELLGPKPSEHHYNLLDEALQELSCKGIRVPVEGGVRYLPVFEEMSYGKYDGAKLSGAFSEHVAPYVKDLTAKFALPDIAKMMMLKHGHTHRLFWYLRHYAADGGVRITVDDLKDVVLGVRKYKQHDAEYERYYDFKTRVVDQAVLEIRDKRLLNVSYKEVRTKRQVTELLFAVRYYRKGDELPPVAKMAEPQQLSLVLGK